MSKIRIYNEKTLSLNNQLIISGKDFHYLKNVMRVKVGFIVFVFNENCGEFEAEVIKVDKNDLTLKLYNQTRKSDDENLYDTEIIFSPIRHNRQDFLIEKTCELGVKTLSPVLMKNSAVKNVNIIRMNEIVKQASEQSRRLSIPKVNNLVTLNEKIKTFDFENRNLVYLDERQEVQNKAGLLQKLKNKPVSFLIGCEGGFDSGEFEILSKTPAISISLGSQILRAETAGISTLSLYNLL